MYLDTPTPTLVDAAEAEVEAEALLAVELDLNPSGLTMSAQEVVRFWCTGAGGDDAAADVPSPCMR